MYSARKWYQIDTLSRALSECNNCVSTQQLWCAAHYTSDKTTSNLASSQSRRVHKLAKAKENDPFEMMVPANRMPPKLRIDLWRAYLFSYSKVPMAEAQCKEDRFNSLALALPLTSPSSSWFCFVLLPVCCFLLVFWVVRTAEYSRGRALIALKSIALTALLNASYRYDLASISK